MTDGIDKDESCQPMRAAHFIHRYPPAVGGSESYFARLSRFLVERGDQATVFTTHALDLEAFWSARSQCLPPGDDLLDGVVVKRFPILHWPGRRYLLKLLSLLPAPPVQRMALPCNPISPAMWREAGRRSPYFDVVHAAAFPYAWPIACGLRMARNLKVPFIVTPFLHLGDPDNPHDPTRRAYLGRGLFSLLQAADRIIVQTPSERQVLLDRGISPKTIILQGLGVDPGECTGGNRKATRAAWHVEDSVCVIGHLANNSEEKGTVDLLRAAETLWQNNIRFRIVLAGPEMPNFKRYWDSFEPKRNVIRLGRLSDEEKRHFYSALDVFALPSRSDSFGLVLLEAWANGLPNLGYRAGGIADVIRHERDGLLVRCGDIPGLAAAMQRLLVDGKLRQELGDAGNRRLRKDFNWHDKLQLVREAYQRAHQ